MRRHHGAGAALLATLLTLAACGGEEIPEEAFQECAVLSTVQKSSSGSISGNVNIGGLEDYGIDASGSSSASVTPPADTPCAREIASRLQGLCAVCQQQGEAACETATEAVFDISRTPIEACAACGDGVCSPGESAVENDGDATFCPQDCSSSNCGDGICDALENFSCQPNDPNCIACPQDCNNTCGDGTCEGTESPQSCPQDCGVTCGDGNCERGETPESCPQDCRSTCGDFSCQPDERVESCPVDCQECGDGICSDTSSHPDPNLAGRENANTCAIDCDLCGDGICGRSEVLTDEEADPDNEDPLRRKVKCERDCWVPNDGVCSPGEPPEETDCQGG